MAVSPYIDIEQSTLDRLRASRDEEIQQQKKTAETRGRERIEKVDAAIQAKEAAEERAVKIRAKAREAGRKWAEEKATYQQLRIARKMLNSNMTRQIGALAIAAKDHIGVSMPTIESLRSMFAGTTEQDAHAYVLQFLQEANYVLDQAEKAGLNKQ